jgi:sarcosine oxidase delta subunit
MRKIELMDRYVLEEEYDVWQDFFFSTVDAVKTSYEKWLHQKGATGWSGRFAQDVDLFFDFVYRCSREGE